MMSKFLVPFGALLLLSLSGCCRYFGLCASASVHTSISSPQQFAQPDGTKRNVGLQAAPLVASIPFQSGSCTD
jgi:hypothetical protein